MSALSRVCTKSIGYRMIIVVAPIVPLDATLAAKDKKGYCSGFKGQNIFLRESLQPKNIASSGKPLNTKTEFPLQKEVLCIFA